MTNAYEQLIEMATTGYKNLCKSVLLQKMKEDIENDFDTLLELNDNSLITNEEILTAYVEVITGLL